MGDMLMGAVGCWVCGLAHSENLIQKWMNTVLVKIMAALAMSDEVYALSNGLY